MVIETSLNGFNAMTDKLKKFNLSTALGTQITVNLTNGIISSDGGASVYFDNLDFNDDVEIVICNKMVNFNRVCCGAFQVMPSDFLKLKEAAKAHQYKTEPA